MTYWMRLRVWISTKRYVSIAKIKVDQEYEGIVRQLMTYMMEDSRTIPSVLTALFCARSIERIGDRCQNICEYIFYFVKGQDFRHVGGDELDKLLAGKDPKE